MIFKKIFFSYFIVWPFVSTPFLTRANVHRVVEHAEHKPPGVPLNAILNNPKVNVTNEWNDLYKKSDLSPRPQLWLRIRQSLQKKVSNFEHPLMRAGQNPDRIGEAYKRMYIEFPVLKDLIDLSSQMDQGAFLSHSDFIKMKRSIVKQLIAVNKSPSSELQTFAALEALRALSNIESRVEFPKTKEEIQKEKEEKEEKKKEKKKQDDKEEDPEWNNPKDQYKPKNKDMAQDENSDGAKKKNVDLVLTDANLNLNEDDLRRTLFRQKIYDEFDLVKWSSVPVAREPLLHDGKFVKKLILDPLKANMVDVPVPYGFTLIPGQYPDHKIIEVGPGEFKVQVFSQNPVTMGLARLQKETFLALPTRVANPKELKFWPPSLLLFAQSLKGKSPVEVASHLQKYISNDGGFLYYSKGDKIDEKRLSEIEREFNSLLTQMPEPMAMAHLKAFNCDGAAWIGALLLRDVLNIPVRIVSGRTSAGSKTIVQEKLLVVKSSSDLHAWIEVFDGTHWVPFDMTPKNNIPDRPMESSDVDREQDSPQKESNQPPTKDNKQKQDQNNKGDKDDKKKNEDQREGGKDNEKKDNEKKKGEEGKEDSEVKNKAQKLDSDADQDFPANRMEDLIQAKSTKLAESENLGLVEHILRQNELLYIEHLIDEGYQTPYLDEGQQILGVLDHPSWKNMVERSKRKIDTWMNNAKFIEFKGLRHFLKQVRGEFRQNTVREAKQNLMNIEQLLLTLGDYRTFSPKEIKALRSIEAILRILNTIKHQNSKEYDLVQQMLKDLPGDISRDWIKSLYGADYDKLGSLSNIKLAHDIVNGRLKPLLEMGAANKFLDMALQGTAEPKLNEEATFNRSPISTSRTDLVITNNPLDFPRMLLTPRPGEHLFAPTIQRRQFAIGHLETIQVQDPRVPIERKVTLVYFDRTPSMKGEGEGEPLQAQDALINAFVDKVLSETDEIGRPNHELYLIPFSDHVHTENEEIVHISSREDALAFHARRMNTRTTSVSVKSTDIQSTLEHFYDVVARSFEEFVGQDHKLFQRANMVLFSDGGATIEMERLEAKRRKIPPEVDINMSFISIGDEENETLKALARNADLSSKTPAYRKLDKATIDWIVNIKTDFDPTAFATDQKLSGTMFDEIKELLAQINIMVTPPDRFSETAKIPSQIRLTSKAVSQLSGLRHAQYMMDLEKMLSSLSLSLATKRRLIEVMLKNYPLLTRRSWNEMTHPEEDVINRLVLWGTNGAK